MTDETLRQAQIIILDDDVSTLTLLQSVLSRLGFVNVHAMDHPRGFADRFQRQRPDLVITDLVMPELDGYAILNFVRQHEPRESSLPVLVLTASQEAQSRRKALAAGATDILVKPFDPSELLMRIRNVLRTRFLQLTLADHNRMLEKTVAARTAELERALADLHESQRAMIHQERFRAFGEMASGVVHDFNNALMTIIGYSEMLINDPIALAEQDRAINYLDAIHTAGRDAASVVNRLRDFYRPREEGEPFNALDANALVEEAVKLTEPKWKTEAMNLGKDIRIKWHLERVQPILGNACELREAMMNLIFNAVDAMPRGGNITIRTRQDGRFVQIEVRDEGQGMDPEVRQRCLEPFFTTKGDHGTGLGLPMVFGIVKRHEGTLSIQSEPGRGTSIAVRLPMAEVLSPAIEPVEVVALRPMRVLLVDDDSGTREIVSRYLSGDGHFVTTVGSGAEAVDQFQRTSFDLLITDQGMPGMNGVQLARFLNQLGHHPPIVLLTGFSFDTENLPEEIHQVVRKPVAPDRLREAMGKALRRATGSPALHAA
jgi:signal transduction histidine kinase